LAKALSNSNPKGGNSAMELSVLSIDQLAELINSGLLPSCGGNCGDCENDSVIFIEEVMSEIGIFFNAEDGPEAKKGEELLVTLLQHELFSVKCISLFYLTIGRGKISLETVTVVEVFRNDPANIEIVQRVAEHLDYNVS
jgi:hypothetical protein